MKKQKKVYNWYLWTYIVFSIVLILTYLLGGVIPEDIGFVLVIPLFALLLPAWLLLNIAMLFIILAKKFKRVYIWLPIIAIAVFVGPVLIDHIWKSILVSQSEGLLNVFQVTIPEPWDSILSYAPPALDTIGVIAALLLFRRK